MVMHLSQALYRRGFARLHLGLLVEAEVSTGALVAACMFRLLNLPTD